MPKRYITVGKELDRVFQKEADTRGAPYASLVRQAMEEWAARRGYEVRDSVTWGGLKPKEPPKENSKGQRTAAATV